MTRVLLRALVMVTAGSLAGASALGAEWGDLSGRFVYDGKPPAPQEIVDARAKTRFPNVALTDQSLRVDDKGGLADVVVYLRDEITAADINPELAKGVQEKVVYAKKDGQFVPRIMTIWRDKQTLVLKNNGPLNDNCNLQPNADMGINVLLRSGASADYKFGRHQTVPQLIHSNIYPWVQGYILPRDNPYAAVSALDGTFRIEKLPVGEHEFQAWHEPKKLGTQDWPNGRFKVTIKAGENDLGDIKVDPKFLREDAEVAFSLLPVQSRRPHFKYASR